MKQPEKYISPSGSGRKQNCWVYIAAFLLGAVGYCCLEMGWRGYTHWSMGIAGGGCLAGMVYLHRRLNGWSVWQQALAGALLITAVEWCSGCILNIILEWQVWDYSSLHVQLAGQVCLLFSFFWYLLSFAVFGIFFLAENRVPGRQS